VTLERKALFPVPPALKAPPALAELLVLVLMCEFLQSPQQILIHCTQSLSVAMSLSGATILGPSMVLVMLEHFLVVWTLTFPTRSFFLAQ